MDKINKQYYQTGKEFNLSAKARPNDITVKKGHKMVDVDTTNLLVSAYQTT